MKKHIKLTVGSLVVSLFLAGCTKENEVQYVGLPTVKKDSIVQSVDVNKLAECPNYNKIFKIPTTKSIEYVKEIMLIEKDTKVAIEEKKDSVPNMYSILKFCKKSNGVIEVNYQSERLERIESIAIDK